MIEFEQRVVPFVRGTADAVPDEDHAVSMNRRQHADIGLGTRNDEAVCLPGTKMVQQEGPHDACADKKNIGRIS